MRRYITPLIAALAGLATLGLSPIAAADTPAAAATSVEVADPKGDVENLSPSVKATKKVRQDVDIRKMTYSVSDTDFAMTVKVVNLAATKDAWSLLSMKIHQWDESGDSHTWYIFFENGGVNDGFQQAVLDQCPGLKAKTSKKADTVEITVPLTCLSAESVTAGIQRITSNPKGTMVVSDRSVLEDKLPLA